MIFEKTDTLPPLLQNELLEAWDSEYPSVLHHHSDPFNQYLQSLVNLQHTVVKDDDQNFCAWYFKFDRHDERQFGIIVYKNYPRNGLGKVFIENAKLTNKPPFAWVVDSNKYKKEDETHYISPLNFYLKNGFSLTHERWGSEKIKTVKITWHK
tara:strand:- start:3631 stop:4089 length:459 start_codon:yes stop_codon:yes gene_type:complete